MDRKNELSDSELKEIFGDLAVYALFAISVFGILFAAILIL